MYGELGVGVLVERFGGYVRGYGAFAPRGRFLGFCVWVGCLGVSNGLKPL